MEALVRSTAETISMTKSDYLLALRHIYHDNLLSLKSAKSMFREQLRKMIGVHSKQMRNMEVFAIGAAIQIFSKKAQEVRDVFWKEV